MRACKISSRKAGLENGDYEMTLDYVVTFEFLLDAPITVRGKVSASTAQACARIAIKQAKEKHPRLKWSSLVVLLAQEDVLSGKAHEKC